MDATRADEGPFGVGSTSMLRLGGVAALLLAAGYIAIVPLFAAVGAPPIGAQARLEYHEANAAVWWAIVALSVTTDLLFLPVAIALYTALRRSNQPAMLLAAAFTCLFVALDLAVTWSAYASLINLGQQYATATTAEQRAILVSAAGYPSAVLSSPLQSIDSILTLSIGILISGLVTLRSTLGRACGIAGVTTGAVGIASVAQTALTGALSPLAIAASLLAIAWLVLVGRGLIGSGLSRGEARPYPPSKRPEPAPPLEGEMVSTPSASSCAERPWQGSSGEDRAYRGSRWSAFRPVDCCQRLR